MAAAAAADVERTIHCIDKPDALSLRYPIEKKTLPKINHPARRALPVDANIGDVLKLSQRNTPTWATDRIIMLTSVA